MLPNLGDTNLTDTAAAEDNQTRLSVTINGKSVQVEEQIQVSISF